MTTRSSFSDILPMKSIELKASLSQLQHKAEDTEETIRSLREKLDSASSILHAIAETQSEEAESRTRDQTSFRADFEEIADSINKLSEGLSTVSSRLDTVEKLARGAQTSRWKTDVAQQTSFASLHPASYFEHLDCHIVDHCNLNCASCSTFSPIANRRFASKDLLQRSLKKLHDIMGDKVIRLHLIGGEPLLHPEATDIGRIARKCFPCADIDFTTNGLLVQTMDEAFWKMMRDCNIGIKYTPYPIDFDYKSMASFVQSKGVRAFSASSKPISFFRRMPLDVRGVYSTHKSYSRCPYTDCAQLIEGNLFRCPASGLANILNEKIAEKDSSSKFGTSSLDYLNLEDDLCETEVLSFLSRPIPFCRYCNVSYSDVPWAISRKDPVEWIDPS